MEKNGRAFGTSNPRAGSTHITLMARHREILRLTLLGWSAMRIAAHIGISSTGVRAVMRSPLMQAELEKMQEEADRLTVNTPLRAQVEAELRGSTIEALRLNRRLMNDTSTDAKLRSNIAKHFMDRTLFEVDADGEKQSSYREILRRLDEVDRSLGKGVWLLSGVASSEAGVEGGRPLDEEAPPAREGSHDPLVDAVKRNLEHASIPAA